MICSPQTSPNSGGRMNSDRFVDEIEFLIINLTRSNTAEVGKKDQAIESRMERGRHRAQKRRG